MGDFLYNFLKISQQNFELGYYFWDLIL